MKSRTVSSLARFALWPMLLYLVGFIALTYPAILSFSTHFFTDDADGLQSVWNIWWINKAVTTLHQSPWHTTLLFHPEGTTLVGQTLNPFNGFLCIPLLRVMSLVHAHNLIVVFAFVATGLTTFFLAYHFTRSYWPSLAAGCVVTFSPYHFAHADGHLQLVSMEWVPLFLLCWCRLLGRPRIRTAVAAALVLLLVLLCDYYYVFYCVIAAGLILLWHVVKTRSAARGAWRRRAVPLLLFAAVALATCAPLPVAVAVAHRDDPFVGAHQPTEFSTDLAAPFIPGGRWRFALLTEFYWSNLPGNLDESDVHIGLSVVCMLVYVLIRSRRRLAGTGVWWLLLVAFFLFSLGPVLHVWGAEVPLPVTPYTLLETAFPLLRLSGCPVRMMSMVSLSAGVLFAYGLTMLGRGAGRGRWVVIALLLAVLCVEYLPDPFPRTSSAVPPHVEVLRDLPDAGAVVDLEARAGWSLYYQTVHQKPLAFGYISRAPSSVETKRRRILHRAERGQYDVICREPGVAYLVVAAGIECPSLRLVHRDARANIYACRDSASDTAAAE